MILPLWFDLYNIANAAEYLGIGIWAGRETTPKWGVETIVDGLRVILLSPKSVSIREKARELGVVARQYGGSRKAADEIAKLAAVGVN
jgi:UDP:flavonoid glycosyltransferase YjiC (YdhE family)